MVSVAVQISVHFSLFFSHDIIEVMMDSTALESLLRECLRNLEAKVDRMSAKIDSLEGNVNAMNVKIDSLDRNLSILSENFDSFKGDTNERLLRDKVQKLYGNNFSRRFVVQGISGLVRLLIPSRKERSSYHPRDMAKDSFKYSDRRGASNEPSDMQLQQEGIYTIVGFIHEKNAAFLCLMLLLRKIQQLIPDLLTLEDIESFSAEASPIRFFSASDDGPTNAVENTRLQKISSLAGKIESKVFTGALNDECAYCRLLHYFLLFIRLKKGEQTRELLSDSGFSLLLFSSCIGELEAYFPFVDLEFDCRGEMEQFGCTDQTIFVISAGEIKSSVSGVPKAKAQLSKRLIVMKEALKLMPHYKKVKAAQIILKGVIFLPVSESKEMTGRDVSPPLSTQYSLEVVYC